MFLFVSMCMSNTGNNGRGGSFSIQIPTSTPCTSVWSSSGSAAHVGKRGRRVRGMAGDSWTSSADKPRWMTLTHVSKAIKAAFGVFQGWKVAQKLQVASAEASASQWVVLSVKATKLFAKGLKVSHTVLTSKLMLKGHPATSTALQDLASLVKGLNAFYAAMKVVQFTKGLGRQAQEGQLYDGECIWEGYKLSKSLVYILDPVVGKSGWAFTHAGKGFLALKNTVGGISVVVKAALLSRELCSAVLWKLAISGASGHQTSQMGMLVHRSHRSKPTRLSCTAIAKGADFRNLLLASLPYGSRSNDCLFSLICLFNSLAEDSGSPFVNFCEDDNQSVPFYLAIPLPSREILV